MYKYLLLIIIINIGSHCYAQSDSLTVFFVGRGSGESFKFLYKNEILFEGKVRGPFKYSMNIPRKDFWEVGEPIENIIVLRRGKFGLWYRDTYFQANFESKKYLIIRKNKFLKNRVAIEYVWSNSIPEKPPRLHAK